MSALRRVELDDRDWTAFVAARPEATAFHRPAWSALLAECYGFRPFALVHAEDGSVRAGLPVLEIRSRLTRRTRWSSLPFTDACPPLAAGPGEAAALPAELDAARAAAAVERLEVRAELAFPGAGVAGDAVVHTLDLDRDEDGVFRRIHASQRRNVRRAEREGVVVRRAEARSDLDRVFYALQLDTRRRLGVPVQPRRFFALLWERFLAVGHGFLLLAYAGATPIAGAVFLCGNERLTYKFGASDRAHWALRPNSLVLWRAIQHGCESGLVSMDFGRTERRHAGLLAFKRQWSTAEEPLRYTVLGRGPSGSGRGLASAAEPLIRRAPPVVCRALGEALYRFTA